MLSVNNVSRKVVSAGVSAIPEAGAMISGLVDALWPADKEDIWGQIKDQMETFVNQKLDTLVNTQVTNKLNGLRRVLRDYRQALRDSQSNISYITEKYNFALGQFEVLQDDFKTKNYEFLLLPLFAQMVNLHLALLRDGALNGAKWNWDPKIIDDTIEDLETLSAKYVAWAESWYNDGLAKRTTLTPYVPAFNFGTFHDHTTALQWNINNKYVREMTLQVMDYAYYWPYFSPLKGPAPKLTREIYSDLQGTSDRGHKIEVDSSVKDRITKINIWAWDWPYGLQVIHRPLWDLWKSPEEQAPQIGASGGDTHPPHGCSEEVTVNNPVVKVQGRSGDLVNELGLTFRDGRVVRCGGYPGGNEYSWGFDGHILSQIYSTGTSTGSIFESVIFGFRLEDSFAEDDQWSLTGIRARMNNGGDYAVFWGSSEKPVPKGWLQLATYGGDPVLRFSTLWRTQNILCWKLVGDDSLEWSHQPAGDVGDPDPFAAHLTFYPTPPTGKEDDRFYGWVQLTEDGPKIEVRGDFKLSPVDPDYDPKATS